ncbi:hypothetical protein SALBM311S_03523 [Streptomyces alboniger]
MPVTPSALTDAYSRLTEVLPVLTVTEMDPTDRLPDSHGWTTAASLAEGGAGLDAFLAWDDAQVRRDHGRPARPDVTAGFGLHRYAWPACLLITAPWFLRRRVPRYPVAHVSYDRTAGPMAFAVHPGPFACLPGDPAAQHPDARVVPDEEALRAEVRVAVAEHLEPVLAGFGPRMRRRGRALWGMVTDEIVREPLVRRRTPRRAGAAAGRARTGAAPTGSDQALRRLGRLPPADRTDRPAAAHPGPGELLHVLHAGPRGHLRHVSTHL